MNEVKLIGPKELAMVLNVPVSWIYQRTRLGPEAIPHIKIGKYVRFDLQKVMEFLGKCTAGRIIPVRNRPAPKY